MKIIKIEDAEGNVEVLFIANPKDFKTGSKGFFGTTKGEIDGKRYQIQLQMVEIGSKQRETK